jgi:hypothetical protein
MLMELYHAIARTNIKTFNVGEVVAALNCGVRMCGYRGVAQP